MIDGILESDAAFDAIYPEAMQRASRRFWTPLKTARRAAELLRDGGAQRVLDVGSGVGKLVLVGALSVPEMTWEGVEFRPHLVAIAESARAALDVTTARFHLADGVDHPWSDYDALYFYNTFAENLFPAEEQLDLRSDLTLADFKRRVRKADQTLRALPVGMKVLTFHGLGGRVPGTYENVASERCETGWLRLWVKGAARDDGSFFVETGDAIERH